MSDRGTHRSGHVIIMIIIKFISFLYEGRDIERVQAGRSAFQLPMFVCSALIGAHRRMGGQESSRRKLLLLLLIMLMQPVAMVVARGGGRQCTSACSRRGRG